MILQIGGVANLASGIAAAAASDYEEGESKNRKFDVWCQ
jgi:hypothetical protein